MSDFLVSFFDLHVLCRGVVPEAEWWTSAGSNTCRRSIVFGYFLYEGGAPSGLVAA